MVDYARSRLHIIFRKTYQITQVPDRSENPCLIFSGNLLFALLLMYSMTNTFHMLWEGILSLAYIFKYCFKLISQHTVHL